MSDYDNYPLVWKPQATGDQNLFLVKVPAELSEMTENDYDNLMIQRIGWLIRNWMQQTGETQQQIHQRLSQALRILYLQEPPDLYERGAKDLQPLWWWTQEWGETFVRRNETLATKFQLENEQVSFPLPILHSSDPRVREQWMSDHDEMTLSEWLAALTYGMD